MNAGFSEPLGVGKLLGDTIKLIFTKGWWLMPLAMLVTVPAALLNSYLVITIFSYPQRFDSLASIYIASLAPILVQLVIYFLASALLTFAAYDAVLSRRIRIGYYIGQALRYGPPIILLSLLTSVLIGAGLILVIVPGLYLAACFYVLVPAIMIEQAGFSGMGRSLDLTNGYRFSIVGLVLMYTLLVILIGLIVGYLVGFDTLDEFPTDLSFKSTFIEGAMNAVTFAVGAVLVALVYARLREIKQGVGLEDLTEVFR